MLLKLIFVFGFCYFFHVDFTWFLYSSYNVLHKMPMWINRRETFYWQTQCTKSVCFMHGIISIRRTVKTTFFSIDLMRTSGFTANREVDYTFRQFRFHLPAIEHQFTMFRNHNDNLQWHNWSSCCNIETAEVTITAVAARHQHHWWEHIE